MEILTSSVYKPPSAILNSSDLDILTMSFNWSIAASDFNTKHPLWNNLISNYASNILYNHAQYNDYVVLAPSTPTYYPYSQCNKPDVLDIASVRLPLSV